jgi:ABC-type branched-subunit amino acid transport system substrate-binding protein
MTAASLTRQAIERIDDGDIDDARLILAEALALDPSYESAWLWLAHIVEDPGERRFALEQAASLNSDSPAQQELLKLRRVAPVAPPEVSDVIPPPLPPISSAPLAKGRWRPNDRRTILIGVLGLIALVALVGAIALRGATRAEPIFIAVAGGMSGPASASGREMVQSARLYFDRFNAEGGIDGRPVELLVYDDRNDPETAKAVAGEIVADGRPLLVIGHTTSSASIAAGPIYATAGMPAITSTSTADRVTEGNPWYFRTIFDNHTEGFLMAAYVRHVLGIDHISVVSGSDDYGRSLAAGVVAAFGSGGTITKQYTIEAQGEALDASVQAAVAGLRAEPDPGAIVVAVQAEPAMALVAAVKAAGITAPILGGDAIGSNRFLETLAHLPGDPDREGHIADGLYAASPLIMDSLTSDSLRWFRAYREAYDEDPTWRGASTFDAAIAAATAMQAAKVTGEPGTSGDERTGIREALAALDSPENAVAGLLGPIYFTAGQTTPRAAMFGVARGGTYSSAFEQLRPYAPSASADVDADLASGVAIDVDGQLLERQRIVFAGVNMNEIGELDTANPSFSADFFLWFNYTGGNDATDIDFINAVDPALELGDPVRNVTRDGVTYRLYRVSGRFKAPLQFQDFPFDQQNLVITFQNQSLPSSKLVYAIDRDFLARSQAERLTSGSNAAVSINAIPSWRANEMQLYQGTVGSTALMGDPDANVGSSGIEYSTVTADIAMSRDLAAFLIKNLLPLALLAAITYVSLYFPHSQTGERVAFGVSAILTAAVLLTSVTSVLPQVGYTVAIEWGFYAFIFLSAICIIIGLVGDRLYDERRYGELRRLDLFSHIFYPVFVAGVVLAYVVRYGGR